MFNEVFDFCYYLAYSSQKNIYNTFQFKRTSYHVGNIKQSWYLNIYT